MKIKFATIILGFIFINSLWSSPNINYKIKSPKIVVDINSENIKTLNIDLKKIKNKKQFLENWFLKNYLKRKEKISIQQIRNNKYSISVYKLSLSNDSPTSLNKKYSIIYFEKSNMSFLIPIEFNKIFQCDNELMIGGYKEFREYEFYHIYVLKLKVLKLVMDTSKDCDYGVKVGYFRDDECLEYMPNRFNCEIFNNNEIKFVGKIKNYCQPKVDREESDLTPLEILNIKIIYKYSKSKKKWILKKDSNYSCW